jgi:hypothetical protein
MGGCGKSCFGLHNPACSMTNKSNDTRRETLLLVNALLESLVGVFALRLPDVQAAIRTQAPTMSVDSSYEGSHLILEAAALVNKIKLNGDEIHITVNQIFQVFAVAMWHSLMSHRRYDSIATEPDIQFFKHVRNAAGHDGKWNFKDLRHVARWRDKELTMAHVGQQAFGDFFMHGDLMLLVLDIDKKYFEPGRYRLRRQAEASPRDGS